jgi:hypothetical protein
MCCQYLGLFEILDREVLLKRRFENPHTNRSKVFKSRSSPICELDKEWALTCDLLPIHLNQTLETQRLSIHRIHRLCVLPNTSFLRPRDTKQEACEPSLSFFYD